MTVQPAHFATRPASRELAGMGCMLGAVLVFGSNFAISRHATLNGLTPWDLVALRFIVAGTLLLPVFLRRGGFRSCGGVGWRRGLVLAALGGFPMTMLMLGGLAFAPASHGAALGPGMVTVIGVVGSFLLFGVGLRAIQLLGLLVVVAGLGLIGWHGAASADPQVWKGDLLFVATGLLWGGYPLLLQRWRLDALGSTAIVAVLSLAYLPLYFAFLEPRIFSAPVGTVLLHALNQGVFNVIVGLWLWAKAVELLGAGQAGRFPPLIPVVGTLIAIPLLGEVPALGQVAGVACIVGGLVVVSLAGEQAR